MYVGRDGPPTILYTDEGLYLVDDDNSTLLAISVLGEAFDLALTAVYLTTSSGRPLQLTLIVRTWLLQGGWCISEIAALNKRDKLAYIHTLLFLSRLGRITR